VSRYKYAAKTRDLVWALSDDEVRSIAAKVCHYCGREPGQTLRHINWSPTRKSVLYNGIDRVDNFRGYEADNVVPCCVLCNRAKRDMTQEDFLSWVKQVADYMAKRNLVCQL